MSGPNPFSTSNAPQHNLVSKILTSPLLGAPYQVVVDLVDIHTAYPLQVGSAANPVQLEYVNQLGTTGNPVQLEYVNQLGTMAHPVVEEHVQQLYATGIGSQAFPVDRIYVTEIGEPTFPTTNIYTTNLGSAEHPVTQAYIAEIGDTGSSGSAYLTEATIGTLYCSNIIPPPGGSHGGLQYHGGPGIGITFTSTDATITSLIRGSTGIGLTLGVDNYWNLSLGITGGTGVSVVPTGDTYSIQNTGVLSVTGGTSISVDNTDPQNPKINYNGSSGISGVTGATGISVDNTNPQIPVIIATGIQGVAGGTNVTVTYNSATQIATINSSGGGTGGNPTGPTGQIPYFTSTGLLSVPELAYTGTTLSTPSVQVVSENQTGMIGFATSGGNSSIFSGLTNISDTGNYLNIGPFQGPPTMSIDTEQAFVGIGVTAPNVALDVAGQAVITYNGGTTYVGVTASTGPGSCPLAAGLTYIVRGWGAGGAGNGGIGGAGGYAEVTFVAGPSGATLEWNQLYGGASGGGNALAVDFAGGATFLYVPGGGAGVVGGIGGAAGEPQGSPAPEAGTSPGSTYVSVATYQHLQSWAFTTTSPSAPLSSGLGVTGGIYTGGTINGNVAVVGGTSVITFTPDLIDSEIGDGVTYTVPVGTVVTVQASNIFFPGATFTSLPNDILALANGTLLNVNDGVTSTTGGTGMAVFTGGPPFINPVFNGAQINTGPSGLTVGAGGVTWSTNGTFTFPATTVSSLWFFDGSPGHEVVVTEGNQIFTCPAGTTLGIPYPLTGITNSTIDTAGSVTIPPGSVVTVAERDFTQYGVTGTTFNGVGLGGGGYTGGGNAALITSIPVTGAIGPTASNEPAGGGAGSWYIGTGMLTGVTFAGSGIYPYINEYNRYGVYGGGTTGSTPSVGYIVVEQVITPTVPAPALFATTAVFGSGGLVAGTNLTCPGGTNQQLGNITCNTIQTTSPGTVTVGGLLTANAGIGCTGGITGSSTLTVGGLLTANAGIGCTGGITGSSTLTVGGLLTANAGITCSGTIYATSTITGSDVIATTSDVRSKHDIVTIDSALEKVMKLRGVYYSRNEDDQRRVGVIAQEMECVLPEVVFTDSSEDKNKSVSYGNIVGLLIEAIKEQQEIIKKLM